MIVTLSPTQSEILAALRVNLLQQLLPQGSAQFNGSLAGGVLTVASVSQGSLAVADFLFGAGVAPNTQIQSQLTGTAGGPGTYQTTGTQTTGTIPMNTGVPIIQGQGNRVAPPAAANYLIFTPMFKPRLATNVDTYQDAAFVGTISNTVLTVTGMILGEVEIGDQLFGPGVLDGTVILSQTGGTPGGVGTYQVSIPQATSSGAIGTFVIGGSPIGVSGAILACGTLEMMQEAELHIQADFFGPQAGDLAQIVSTAFRDEVALDLLATAGLTIDPLYADDPRQSPFVDGEQQYEDRWSVDMVLQANQTVTVPQQFAQSLVAGLIEVEATYPP